MKRKTGTVCMILGAAFVLAALSLLFWNRLEDKRAGDSANLVLSRLDQEIGGEDISDDTGMREVEIDGYFYIGILSVPSRGLKLPVMASWNYQQLKIAPCRYAGSTKTGDLVIAGHNYTRHFGPIRDLAAGDEIYFMDMDGVVTAYEVAVTDTLRAADVEEMTDSGYELTLFTCSYGGKKRVAVRCSAIE